MDRILGVIDRAEADGATLLTGGIRLGGDLADGWFVAPTVFGDVDHDSDLARHEVFGPVQAILRFSTEDEVLAKANDSGFGLGAYVHTRDIRPHPDGSSASLRRAPSSSTGSAGSRPATPFGGYKQSGFGREGGRAGIEEMVRPKTVMVAP